MRMHATVCRAGLFLLVDIVDAEAGERPSEPLAHKDGAQILAGHSADGDDAAEFHSSLTSGSWPASRRVTLPRRWSVRSPQPEAQCSQTDGVDTRSNGRLRKRYDAEVSAPTGQIWIVLPEK